MCTNSTCQDTFARCGIDDFLGRRDGGAQQGTTQREFTAMALLFIGIDPNTGHNGSPTVWVDPGTGDLVVQSYIADEPTRQECVDSTAPGHAKGIPDHETAIRIPPHMIPILRRACDAAERSGLQGPAGSGSDFGRASGDA
jgi:hypothetical protein